MPKNQFIEPNALLKSGWIEFDKIPVNQYSKKASLEAKIYTKDQLLWIYKSLSYIRHFEEAVLKLKSVSGYNGLKINFEGPTHLSIGQEAAAVGQAFCLNINDITFGSHRNHADLIAKGLKVINDLDNDSLLKIIKNHKNTLILDTVDKYSKGLSVKERSVKFYLYGAMSEIFGRITGFHKGFCGSMHLNFPMFGVYPNNGIVGAQAPISVGAALYKKLQNDDGIVVCNIGDGAMGSGVVYESLNFSSMDQFNYLWQLKGGLPIIFAFSDNGYGMGGQTKGETMSYGHLARIGAGISPSGLYAERINGNNPLAVIDAFKRKKEIVIEKKSPVLIDIVTYRFEGHSNSDKSSYRIEEEILAWKKFDPLITFQKRFIDIGVFTLSEIENINNQIELEIFEIAKMVHDENISPFFDINKAQGYLKDILFSPVKKDIEKFNENKCNLMPKHKNPVYKKLSEKNRDEISVKEAIFEAVFDMFYKNPRLISYGEEVREWGGISGVYDGLCLTLPYERLFNTPISEATIVSSAIGYAMMGGSVIIEIMFSDFLARCADELFNQLAKWHSISGGYFKLNIVIRVSIGAKYGTQHSQDWSSLVAHIPGLKVYYPTTPYDAKGLMNTALTSNNPVIFFESQQLYKRTCSKAVPKEYYEIPEGQPEIFKAGNDITVLAVGAAILRAVDAAVILERDYKISVEIIDARCIVPFNYEKVINSAKRTGKIAVVGDMVESASILTDFSSNIAKLAFKSLKSAPVIIGAKNTVAPPYQFNNAHFPSTQRIVDEILYLYKD